MGEAKKGNRSTGTDAAREELTQELRHLRTLVREVGEQFILRREGEIETIISNLAAIPVRRLKGVVPGLLHEIQSLRLKPAKGRLKDLKGIDALIEDLTERVIAAQDEKTRPG
jgi:hypothetical protein